MSRRLHQYFPLPGINPLPPDCHLAASFLRSPFKCNLLQEASLDHSFLKSHSWYHSVFLKSPSLSEIIFFIYLFIVCLPPIDCVNSLSRERSPPLSQASLYPWHLAEELVHSRPSVSVHWMN